MAGCEVGGSEFETVSLAVNTLRRLFTLAYKTTIPEASDASGSLHGASTYVQTSIFLKGDKFVVLQNNMLHWPRLPKYILREMDGLAPWIKRAVPAQRPGFRSLKLT